MREVLLDTNVLIALSSPTHRLFKLVESILGQGGCASTCVIAWHEYIRGPLTAEDHERVINVIESRILPLDRSSGELATKLFNETGRRRGSTADCLIAATAILNDYELVTWNYEDFEKFVSMGLKLIR
jgi:predicted nucleic acid-binding protein